MAKPAPIASSLADSLARQIAEAACKPGDKHCGQNQSSELCTDAGEWERCRSGGHKMGSLVDQANAAWAGAPKVLGKPACQREPCKVSPASHSATCARSASNLPMSMPVAMPMLPSM